MTNSYIRNSILILLVLISVIGYSSETTHKNTTATKNYDVKKDIKETIKHHLQDSYSFEITHGVGFPLPIILFDDGIHIFSSSKFHHGEQVVESKGNYYKLDAHHGKIYKTDALGTINFDENHNISNTAPFDFSITKNVFVLLLMSLFIFFVFSKMAKNIVHHQILGELQNFLSQLLFS